VKARGWTIPVFFGLFWSTITLLFDAFNIIPMVRQVNAIRFPSAEGVMISSEVTRHSDSDGSTHGVAMGYSYTVAGREYEGHLYRYDKSASSDSAWAQRAVSERPPGRKVPVFYNPHNPEDAVLVPGILGSDLFMLAFMTPFNAVMLGFVWVGWARLRQAWFKPVAGGVRIIAGPRETRVRLTAHSPAAVGIATAALLAFASIFIVAFLMGGFHPSLQTMRVTWMLILGGGVSAGLWHWSKMRAGHFDLIIDEFGDALELPLTNGRKTRRRLGFAQIRDVRVDVVRNTTSDGEATPAYAPALDLTEAQPATERLVEWYHEAKAAAFVEWLRTKLPPPRKNPERPVVGEP
jgi:hypothetical protein